ncbi:MAG: glucose-1-phosphate cytidylyltransferase [Acidobacteria bacterium]|nr:glucose-1-phosphate cytidylyltransferase [Acidobacteriota bacterium]
MKVVLFCGGLGMRLRDFSENIPKPMVPIGYRPILWHVMKYYAHFGYKDFILCLGYRADVIKNYFLKYDECLSNDFVLTKGGTDLQMLNSDIHDWKITFADTGADSNIGQRLKAVQKYLEGEEVFLANYTDSLTDFHLPELIERFRREKKIGAFLCVRPHISYHFVSVQDGGLVGSIKDISETDILINGGYFIFSKAIFNYIKDGEELVFEPFRRLIGDEQLLGHVYKGFWKSMDTFKDKQHLDDVHAQGKAPWEVWKRDGSGTNR